MDGELNSVPELLRCLTKLNGVALLRHSVHFDSHFVQPRHRVAKETRKDQDAKGRAAAGAHMQELSEHHRMEPATPHAGQTGAIQILIKARGERPKFCLDLPEESFLVFGSAARVNEMREGRHEITVPRL